ncbi:caspase-like [Anopheles ziemanni]|uniref:caspase-like n=1 Tax=Anopheles coustani TaxID=139045 RepID=UPI00265A04BB|nr:caspase-like [Anopheles coustani]XP_058170746.1 caspase-like [Anopheles ziemanni]
MGSNHKTPDEVDTRMMGQSTLITNVRSSVAGPAQPVGEADDTTYNMRHRRRGIAVVINQVQFRGMKQREGSNRDRDKICAALEKLHFQVEVFEDLSREKLFSSLQLIADVDHKQHDCLVVVVMTHGSEDVLHASDSTYKVDRLWELFLGNACPSLLGKPKLFFIQACRGEKFDEGVLLQVDSIVTDTVDARGTKEGPPSLLYVIPTMADLLVMYSTYKGHYSWRNPSNGSWFIQSLSSELAENGDRMELLQLLTTVSRRVAYDYRSYVPDNARMDAMKQMPCIVSMLTKALYFTPHQPS